MLECRSCDLINLNFDCIFFVAFLGMSSSNSYFYAAIVAIIAVHVVLGLFIYAAWNEGRKPTYKAE